MTEEKEVYKSIFDAASKIEKKKHRAQEPAKSTPPASQPVSVGQGQLVTIGQAAGTKPAPTAFTDDEIKAQFEECRRLHNLLVNRVESMLGEKKLTIKNIREYFDSARNFSDKEWKLIEKQKKAIDAMLNKLVPRVKERTQKGAKGKSDEKAPKKMQVKSRWISMR